MSSGRMRMAKEEAVSRLREKIKNKQSRRHIYHSLKTKCDAWNKVRLKTQQQISRNEGVSPLTMQLAQTNRLHCKQVSQNPKIIQSFVIKSNPRPNMDSSNPLKIISKPCMISLNAFTNPSPIQSPTKEMNISLSGNPESPNTLRSKKDIYQ
jgi:hypothetical protein